MMANEQPGRDTIFCAAIELKSPEERAEYLDQACQGHLELRREVQELVDAHFRAGSFLQVPAGPIDPTRQFAQDRRSNPSAIATEIPGSVIGPYKLIQPIGEGGMGTVFLAQQSEPVKRLVALKVIKPGMDSSQVLARFEAERQALALMNHPNIAQVLDAGTTDKGRPYFVMELVKGVTITAYCDEKRLTPRERLELLVPVCQAVQHAHQKGIIHRDLKPSNVLVALYDGRPVPKVIDFGVAKATGQQLTDRTLVTGFGAVVGTLEYMSPEQAEINQLDVDTRSDVYSLGVLMYELLTGTTPLERKRLKHAALLEALRVIREEEPPRPSTRLSTTDEAASIAAARGVEPRRLTGIVRGELDWIVMKALEKDRTRRYETANGLAADIQRFLSDEPVLACPPSAAYRLRKFARRNWRSVVAAAVVFLSLAVGVTVATWQALRALRAERVAVHEKMIAERARDAEEQARRAEAIQRSLAEDQARQANNERARAITAEADTRAFSDFVVNDILAVARPKGERGGLGIEVTVKAALDAAIDKVESRFASQPRAEAIARHDLGVTYRLIGELEKSIEQLRRAFELRQANLGPDDSATLDSENSLAVAYVEHGDFARATPLLVEVIAAYRRTLGDEHPDTILVLGNLAAAYVDQKQFAKAEPLCREVLEFQKRVKGVEHQHTLHAMNNLAIALQGLERFQEAGVLLETVVEANRKTFGDEHRATLAAMSNLATIYQLQGRTSAAESLLVNILHVQRGLLGDDSPPTLTTMSNLAAVYLTQGQFEKAEPLLLKSLEIQSRRLNEEHPARLATMTTLGVLYNMHGQLDKARPLFEKVLELRRRAPAPRGAELLNALSNLIALYQASEEFARAEPLCCEAIDIALELYGMESLPYASAAATSGFNLLGQGKYADAEQKLRQALAIREQKLPHDWLKFNTQSLLGASLLGQNRDEQAGPLLLAGYEGLANCAAEAAKARSTASPPVDRLNAALRRLIEFEERRGNQARADEWRKRLEPLQHSNSGNR